jgi:hypothetical protein
MVFGVFCRNTKKQQKLPRRFASMNKKGTGFSGVCSDHSGG